MREQEEVIKCARCGGKFATARLFNLHVVPATDECPIATCLDVFERHALGWKRQARGTWATDITTDVLPSQVRRLASISRLVNAYERDGIEGLELALFLRDKETNALVRMLAKRRSRSIGLRPKKPPKSRVGGIAPPVILAPRKPLKNKGQKRRF